MSIQRVKEWSTGDILTASELNAEFNNITGDSSGAQKLASPRLTDFDMAGKQLILDANSDTSITADTDNQIDFRLGGSDIYKMTSTGFDGAGTNRVRIDGVFVGRSIRELRTKVRPVHTTDIRIAVEPESHALAIAAMTF